MPVEEPELNAPAEEAGEIQSSKNFPSSPFATP